jgi:hypothetical protein
MADGSQSTSVAPRRVLLLADAVREEWTRALEAGGLEVSTTGWHDAVTAARLRRPDVVLVSTDLPANAPQAVCDEFRSAVELATLPIVVAGPGAKGIETGATWPLRADHYVAGPVDLGALAERIRVAEASGRIGFLNRRASRVVLGLLVASAFALLSLAPLELYWRGVGAERTRAGEWLAFAAIALPLAAAIAVATAARTRRLSVAEWRSVLGFGGLVLLNCGRFVPGAGVLGQLAGGTLGLLAWAGWAWLGPSPTPWFVRSRRAFQILAVILALLAVAPWAAMLLLR